MSKTMPQTLDQYWSTLFLLCTGFLSAIFFPFGACTWLTIKPHLVFSSNGHQCSRDFFSSSKRSNPATYST